MFKKAKIFRKLIAILTIITMILPSFYHNSMIMANTQEVEVEASEIVENETSENGEDETVGSPENGQDETTEDTGSVEDEAIPEDGNINEEQPEDTDQNQGIDGEVTEEPSSLIGPLNRNVGQTFYVATDGVNINYTVLSEDSVTKTGTVTVGNTSTQSSGNAFKDNTIPTDNTLTIPATVTNGDFTYTVTELHYASLSSNRTKNLTLPASLRSIGAKALSGITAETLIIPEGVTHIGDFALSDLKNLKVLKLPSTLKTLGSTILGNNLSTQSQLSIYYPYINTITKKSEGNNSNAPFYSLNVSGAKKTLVITDNAEQYNRMKTDSYKLFSGTGNECVTYEIPLEFYDKDLNSISVDKQVTKLFYQDILWEKGINDVWNTSFTSINELGSGLTKISDLPTLPSTESLGYQANYWGIGEMGLVTIDTEGTVKATNTLEGDHDGSLGTYYLTSPKMFAFEKEFEITETTS